MKPALGGGGGGQAGPVGGGALIEPAAETGAEGAQRAVEFRELGLQEAVEGLGLAQDGEVFLLVVAGERGAQFRGGGFAAVVFEFREGGGVAFAGEDGVDDGHAADAVEVAEDVVELEVAFGEDFLHHLHLLAGGAHEVGALAHEVAQGAHFGLRAVAALEQPGGVQAAQPFGVGDVGFEASGDAFDVARVDEPDGDAGGFQHVGGGHPVVAGAFHGHGADGALVQPVAQAVQLRRGGAKGLHGAFRAGFAHGDHEFSGAHVDARSGGMDGRKRGGGGGGSGRRGAAGFARFGEAGSFHACLAEGGGLVRRAGRGMVVEEEISSLPNGVRPLPQPATNAFDARTMTTLTNGVNPTNGTPAYGTAPDPRRGNSARARMHARSQKLLPHFFRPGGEGANHALQRTGGASRLQSLRPVRRVAELGSFGGTTRIL